MLHTIVAQKRFAAEEPSLKPNVEFKGIQIPVICARSYDEHDYVP